MLRIEAEANKTSHHWLMATSWFQRWVRAEDCGKWSPRSRQRSESREVNVWFLFFIFFFYPRFHWLRWRVELEISVWCRLSTVWLAWPMKSLESAAGWSLCWTGLGKQERQWVWHSYKSHSVLFKYFSPYFSRRIYFPYSFLFYSIPLF